MAFGYKRSITIDYTKVQGSTQTNFPALIAFTHNDLRVVGSGGHVQNSNGYDICFYSDSGLTTPLKWEMEKYTSSTGEVIAWVKIPSLSHTVNTVIYIAYGDVSLTTFQSVASDVWDSSYKLVCHLQNLTTDSTSGAFALTNQNTVTSDSGQIADSAEFISASSQRIVGPANTVVSTVVDNFTLSAWLFSPNAGPALQIAVSLSDDLGGYQIGRGEAGGAADFKIMGLFGGVTWIPSSSYFPDSAWVHVCLRRSGGTGQLYVNGVASGSSVANTPNSPQSSGGNRAVSIGCQYQIGTPGRHWDGKIDEVRFSETVRSTDWMTTEYRNQSNPSTFFSLGSETPLAVAHEGAAALTTSFAQTSAGLTSKLGASTLTTSFTKASVGLVGKLGASALTSSFVQTSAGLVGKLGASALSTTWTQSAAGSANKFGAASLSFNFVQSGVGLVGKLGASSLSFNFSQTGAGVVGHAGASALSMSFAQSGAGLTTVQGSAALTASISLAAASTVDIRGSAALGASFLLSCTVEGNYLPVWVQRFDTGFQPTRAMLFTVASAKMIQYRVTDIPNDGPTVVKSYIVIKDSWNDPDGEAKLFKSITVVEGASGRILPGTDATNAYLEFVILPSDLLAVAPGEYIIGVKSILSDGRAYVHDKTVSRCHILEPVIEAIV